MSCVVEIISTSSRVPKSPKYRILSSAERSEISALIGRGLSIREIARSLERSPNTISREIKVNSVTDSASGILEYNAIKAKAKSRISIRSRRYQWQKIEKYSLLRDFITKHLSSPYDWTPASIAGYLRTQQTVIPSVTAQNIYDWLYSSRGQAYCACPPSKRYRPKKHTNKTNRVMIPDRVSITERPIGVEDRLQVGNWEFDSIVSSKRSGSKAALAVANERTTRLLRAMKVPDLKPREFAAVIISLVIGFIAYTLTGDNGIENKCHSLITTALGAIVYFTDPYSSWQKGGVENANKMLRRYFPKGTDFSKVSKQEVDEAVRRINNKPRAILGYKSAVQCAIEKGLLLDGGVLVEGGI
jgi:transposase, IS30 family